MAEFIFPCPSCGQQIQADVSYGGTQINCPSCHQLILVPQPSNSPTAAVVKKNGVKWPVVIVSLVILFILTAGAFLFWKFAMPFGLRSGGDHNPVGNDAVLTDIKFVDSGAGKALSFDGKNSTIKIPSKQSLDLGEDKGFTIMMWIKPKNVNGLHPIMQWSDEGSLNLWIGVRPYENGVLRGDISDEQGNHFVCSHPDTLKSGVFQHIAFTYDKTSGMGVLYVNGIIVARRDIGQDLVAKTKGDIWLSQPDHRPGNWSTGRMFSGLMDEPAIYDHALSQSEIQKICSEQNHGEPLEQPEPSDGWFESWMR